MHKLETRYLFYGSKCNPGSFGVIGVKFWFSLKMHYLFYVTKYIHVIHTLASHLQNKQGNWGQSGVDVSQPAMYAVCDGNMSSYPARAAGQGLILHQLLSSFFFFFFLLLSSICQHANISDTLGPIMLILCQSNKSVNAHFWHDRFGVKGHDGVTGVKKVIFTKIAISSTGHMVWSCDSCILIS